MVKNIELEEDLLCARKTPSGYTWTLASRLRVALRMAEQLYGKRDESWTLCGVEINPDVIPRVWYPGNEKAVIIQLNRSCLKDMGQACYQLSHEVIHLLDPLGHKQGSVLEEGLATHFSEVYSASINMPFHSNTATYSKARDLVKTLLNDHPQSVKKMRAAGHKLTGFAATDLKSVEPNVSEKLAKDLAASFAY